MLPRDTRIRHALSPFQPSSSGGWDVLASLDEVRFEHDAHDERCSIGRLELLRDVLGDIDLAAVLFGGVAVGAVDLEIPKR